MSPDVRCKNGAWLCLSAVNEIFPKLEEVKEKNPNAFHGIVTRCLNLNLDKISDELAASLCKTRLLVCKEYGTHDLDWDVINIVHCSVKGVFPNYTLETPIAQTPKSTLETVSLENVDFWTEYFKSVSKIAVSIMDVMEKHGFSHSKDRLILNLFYGPHKNRNQIFANGGLALQVWNNIPVCFWTPFGAFRFAPPSNNRATEAILNEIKPVLKLEQIDFHQGLSGNTIEIFSVRNAFPPSFLLNSSADFNKDTEKYWDAIKQRLIPPVRVEECSSEASLKQRAIHCVKQHRITFIYKKNTQSLPLRGYDKAKDIKHLIIFSPMQQGQVGSVSLYADGELHVEFNQAKFKVIVDYILKAMEKDNDPEHNFETLLNAEKEWKKEIIYNL